jgi:hypothetical protein
MVPPQYFQYNPETAESNSFQSKTQIPDARERALQEFSSMVSQLRDNRINVLILEQKKGLPDAVFPNNWFSMHIDDKGKNILIIYPMLTKNRQAEVNIEGLQKILCHSSIEIHQVIDLRNNNQEILEGTGSLVLDRINRQVYASLSPRTSLNLVNKVAELLNYQAIVFNSVDTNNQAIYHTNVLMSIASQYAVICLESIKDLNQRATIERNLSLSNKLIIDISLEQMKHFCGNVLELKTNTGDQVLVLSKQAYQNFTNPQLKLIERFATILPINLKTIETLGGGSARCMIAEISSFPEPGPF